MLGVFWKLPWHRSPSEFPEKNTELDYKGWMTTQPPEKHSVIVELDLVFKSADFSNELAKNINSAY